LALSNEQIERYSRQIIVPGVGSVGQERLLAAHLVIAGELADIEPVLAYMAGAGVGRIGLLFPGPAPAAAARLIGQMRDSNPDVAAAVVSAAPADSTLVLAIAGSSAALRTASAFCEGCRTSAVVFARLDAPAKVAIVPAPPPCLACADAGLLAPFSQRCENAGLIAMIAATESFKLLAGCASASRPTLIEFSGYESAARELHMASNRSRCGCCVKEPGGCR
jgi:hypothetical protein